MQQPKTETERLVVALEIGLLDPVVRSSPAQLEDLIAQDFIEIGKSGKIYNKEQIIVELLADAGKKYSTLVADGFMTKWLADDVLLVVYKTRQVNGDDPRPTRRASVWKQSGDNWLLKFHQGTPVGLF